MPELPEVEATRRLLIKHARGQRIIAITSGGDDEKVFEQASPADVCRAFERRTVADVRRLGKQFWLVFEDSAGPTPVMHLGMTGQVWVRTPKGETDAVAYVRDVGNGSGGGGGGGKDDDDDGQQPWPPRFSKLELELSSGARVALCDARRFARVRLVPAGVHPMTHPPLSKLGFDPLLSAPDLYEFIELLSRRRSAKLKALLLDQSFSAGVGNWVADEVLFMARLHPLQAVADVLDAPEDEAPVVRLHSALRHVCERACAADADSRRFPGDWLFHARWTGGKATRMPDGERVEFITAGGRTTAYVPSVQRMLPVVSKSISGSKARGAPLSSGGGGKKKQQEEEAGGEEDVVVAPAARSKPKKAAVVAAAAGGKKKKKRGEEEEDDDDEGRKVSRSRSSSTRGTTGAATASFAPPSLALASPPPPRQQPQPRQPRPSLQPRPLNNDNDNGYDDRRGPRDAAPPPPPLRAARSSSSGIALAAALASSLPRPLLRGLGGGGARGVAGLAAGLAGAVAAQALRR